MNKQPIPREIPINPEKNEFAAGLKEIFDKYDKMDAHEIYLGLSMLYHKSPSKENKENLEALTNLVKIMGIPVDEIYTEDDWKKVKKENHDKEINRKMQAIMSSHKGIVKTLCGEASRN